MDRLEPPLRLTWLGTAALLLTVACASGEGFAAEEDPSCNESAALAEYDCGTADLAEEVSARPRHRCPLSRLGQKCPHRRRTGFAASNTVPDEYETIWLEPLPEDYVVAEPEDGLEEYEAAFVEPDDESQPVRPWDVAYAQWWTRDLSVFGGVHGFKGPFDRGRNGNFGFHEGFNFGAPLGFWDWGWQAGMNAVHSNLSGNETFGPSPSVRNQFFFTGGLFRRAKEWGCQWGLTYDWLHDEYYAKTDLKQIRSDTSLLLPGGMREIGYFGAYGTGGTDFVLLSRELRYYVFMEPTDIFAFYYRRYFEGGGDGRVWLGWTGRGDGVLGGEIRVPMGHSWALENRVNYLIPKQGHGGDAAVQESWGLTLQLVWYPGSRANLVRNHPYRPMLSVADNTLFMTNTFVPPASGL